MMVDDIKQSKIELLDAILTRIKDWDSDLEEGIKLIEKNDIDIKKIQEYGIKTSEESSEIDLSDDYKEKIDLLKLEMGIFLGKMENKKQILLEEKKQLGKNNEIIANYIISDFKPAFIDKNV